jgi:hypothetical protein
MSDNNDNVPKGLGEEHKSEVAKNAAGKGKNNKKKNKNKNKS